MLIIQKYGGVTLETPEKIKAAARRISEVKNSKHQIVAVVSAMGQTTNQLLDLSQQVSQTPLLRELDMLLSVGERISMALVSIALNDLGHEAISLTGSQAGIMTDETHLNAIITDVKAHRVTEALAKNKIVILAGFQGVNPESKEITTLGRGGTDTSAVAMAIYLKADRCEILKDVPSIFSADPKIIKNAKPLKQLSYPVLLDMTYWGAKVLHYRSVELASLNKVNLYVGPAAQNNSIETNSADTNSTNSENYTLGTYINEDIMFETTKPISVNSHETVLKINITDTQISSPIEILLKTFREHQIGTPQVLFGTFQNNINSFYITGPQEMLNLIKKFSVNNSLYEIDSQILSSVSLTCTGSSLNDVLVESQKALSQQKIKIYSFTQSAMSLNFFVTQNNRTESLKALHSLIDL